ncbi:MAG TPA: LLM class flavin-dependent oxidoreductase [Dehalococcoidia bacterium]|nr:LLM class flavin-dependent oxidoreductase [Dehalococcoidia bacterium]
MAIVSYGLRIPAVHPADLAAIRAFVVRAEELGFSSIWASDHVFYKVDVLQPLHLLTWISAFTTRVRLSTAVMLSAYLNPVLLAREAATIDCLSNGRLSLGMSLGGTPAEYSSIGVPMNQRLGRLLESVEIMRRLWSQDGVNYKGRYHEIVDGTINPKPVQAGGVPIFLGATREPMLRRIPRVADGWIGSAGRIDSFLAGVETVLSAANEIERDPASLSFAKLQSISVAPTAAEARAAGELHWQAYYGPNFDIDAATIYGTPDECRTKLAAFEDATCDEVTVVLEPAGLSPAQLEMLAGFTTRG